MINATLLRYAVLASLIANALLAFGWQHAISQRNAARQERDALRADVAEQRAAFEAKARQQEREQHQALAGVREIFDQEMSNAQTQHDAVVADLRAGALRLRSHWQAHLATAELSAAVAAASRADDGTELRARGAADLVRIGAECDTRIRGLQSAVRAYSGGTP